MWEIDIEGSSSFRGPAIQPNNPRQGSIKGMVRTKADVHELAEKLCIVLGIPDGD